MLLIYRIIGFLIRSLRFLERKSRLQLAVSEGLTYGENCKFVGSQYFGSEPYLIEIGRDCLLTDGIKFVTHDGGIQVPFIARGELIDDVYGKKSAFGNIKVGANVFIGVDTVLLKGCVIGDNCIVAAGAVLKGSYPQGSVIAGVPGKVICTIDEYFVKNEPDIIDFSDAAEGLRAELILAKTNGKSVANNEC